MCSEYCWYVLFGEMWKTISRWIQPDLGTTAWVDMAGLGSKRMSK